MTFIVDIALGIVYTLASWDKFYVEGEEMKFKEGDRVVYLGPNPSSIHTGVFTIVSSFTEYDDQYRVKEDSGFAPLEENLRSATKLDEVLS